MELALAVMDKGKIVFSRGAGSRRFNIGSVSKVFVSVAALRLVEEGKLRLDHPLYHYLPDFRMKDERYREITVRMLFNHSSGLPGSSWYATYSLEKNSQQLLLGTLANEHLKHRPGDFSVYCNDGFQLAEILVERVSGQRYLDFLQERIFEPLGMWNSGASLGELPGPDMAESIDPETGRRYPPEVMEIYGAGGLSSSVEDLCRFGNSFSAHGPRILSDASLKEIRRAQPTRFSDKLRGRQLLHSFGWDYHLLGPGVQVLGKKGATPCYSANLQIVPDLGQTVALCVAANVCGESLTRPIFSRLAVEHSARPLEFHSIPVEFDRFLGFYAGQTPAGVQVSIRPGRTEVVLESLGNGGKPVYNLVHRDGTFWDLERNLRCYFACVEGKNYLVGAPSRGGADYASLYGVDMLLFQQLEALEQPLSLQTEVHGRRWLIRNAPTSVLAKNFPFVVASSALELDGYLDFAGLKKIESPTYASIAASCFRDQTELNLLPRDGRHWARLGIHLYSPGEAAGKAGAGPFAVVIGAEGYNEWLELENDAMVSIKKPCGRVVMVSAAGETLFDSVLDAEDLFAPVGSLIFFAGPPGSRFLIHCEIHGSMAGNHWRNG